MLLNGLYLLFAIELYLAKTLKLKTIKCIKNKTHDISLQIVALKIIKMFYSFLIINTPQLFLTIPNNFKIKSGLLLSFVTPQNTKPSSNISTFFEIIPDFRDLRH